MPGGGATAMVSPVQDHNLEEDTMPTNQRSNTARSLPSPWLVAAAALAALAAAILLLNAPKLQAAGTSGTAVSTAKTSLGRVLVNSRGHTLYLLTKDRNGKSACTGKCATFWPPVITAGKPRAGAGVRASLLGTTRRANGRLQVTYNHHPLYTFVKDTKKGQTNGEQLSAFGGVWYAVSPAGARVVRHPVGNGIPQHNGGDHDADNNGGPSDGDGNI
jgi:predicted lipoprotein with Yx(FWY)xxD motif